MNKISLRASAPESAKSLPSTATMAFNLLQQLMAVEARRGREWRVRQWCGFHAIF
jgi:hypothetical protein